MTITQTLCQEFQTAPWQIDAVIRLLDEGCTLPFIARYRKEQHGSLDDQKLREISERLTALRALEARRQEISESLQKLDVWTEKLQSTTVCSPYGSARSSRFPFESRSSGCLGCCIMEILRSWMGPCCRRWISSAAAARVRICPWPEPEPGLPESAPVSSWNRSAS